MWCIMLESAQFLIFIFFRFLGIKPFFYLFFFINKGKKQRRGRRGRNNSFDAKVNGANERLIQRIYERSVSKFQVLFDQFSWSFFSNQVPRSPSGIFHAEALMYACRLPPEDVRFFFSTLFFAAMCHRCILLAFLWADVVADYYCFALIAKQLLSRLRKMSNCTIDYES